MAKSKKATAPATKPEGKKAKAAANAALAKGAAEIQKATAAQKGAANGEVQVGEGGQTQMPLPVVPSNRPVGEIIADRIKVRDGGIGLDIAEGLTPEEWVPVVRHYVQTQEHIGFFVGDLFAYGETHFDKQYAAAVEATGLKYKTLANYKYTALHVAPEVRVPALGYSVHAEVAKLTPAKQKQVLTKAEKNGWTAKETRVEVQKVAPKEKKGGGRKKTTPPADPDTTTASETKDGVTTTTVRKTADMSVVSVTTETPQADGTTLTVVVDGAGKELSRNVSAAAPKVDPERKLTPEEMEKNDAAIEASDTLVDYRKQSDFWKSAPRLTKKQWRNILRPLAEWYEELLSEVGPD